MASTGPRQFKPDDHFERIRKELKEFEERCEKLRNDFDQKISLQASRIDGKLSTGYLLWAIGISVTVSVALFGIVFNAYNNRNDKFDERLRQIENRTTAIETGLQNSK